MKFKLTWKIWLWLIVLLLALISIFITPNFMQKGVLITSIDSNSSAFEQGLRAGQVITSIDGKQIQTIDDFSNAIQGKITGESVKTIIKTQNAEYVIYSNNFPEIIVSELPKTNLKAGLDLSGGARALVKAKDEKLSSSQVADLVSTVYNRLNVYGISDMVVRSVSDLSGNYFMLVEIAGATPKDLEELISKQGKFEAKIGNETVFIGGEKDITSVARSGQQAGIYQCNQIQDGYVCNFRFSIYLSQAAAERQAAITSNLSLNSSSQGNYLSKTLDLYVDDKLVDSLSISADLKGRAETQISIQGSGSGTTRNDAITSADAQMNKLQTILITGSLPFKLEIVKLDTISPTLGNNFTKYIFIAGAVALFLVTLIVFIKYKKLKLCVPPMLILISETVITLGVAAFMKWDLDLPSIAGLLAAIGTNIDDQIVMLDAAEKKEILNVKQKIKRAFKIILGAYATSVVSLLPLWWAGAGLLKGFVFTTVVGITIGVLITRPAFADMVNMIEE